MKRFHFTLTALKTLRERREQEAIETYSKALRYQEQIQTDFTLAKRALETEWSRQQALLNQGISAKEMVQIQAYGQSLIKRCQDKENELALARQSARVKWDQLVRARQQREVVDHFLERQKKRYHFECQREEQKFLDDLACHQTEGALTAPLTLNPQLPS